MKFAKIDDFIKGWVVGNFEPSLYKTNDVEVAYKKYEQNDYDEKHYHKIATEITIIAKGFVRMNDKLYSKGDIIIIEPNDVTDFLAITDSETIVIKLPGANNDKYQ